MSFLLYSFSTSRIAARSRENFASSVSKPTIDLAAAAAASGASPASWSIFATFCS